MFILRLNSARYAQSPHSSHLKLNHRALPHTSVIFALFPTNKTAKWDDILIFFFF